MRNKKRIALAVISVVLLIATTVCFVACVNYEELYSDNSKLSSNSGSYSATSYTSTISAANVCTASASSFSGVKKIKTITAKESPELDIMLKITSGSFKIIAVNKADKTVHILIDKDNTETIKTELPAGEYDVKFVGIKAQFDATIKFKSFEA